MDRIFTAKDLCRIYGISYRKLDYWLNKLNYNCYRTSGNMRVFTEQDVYKIKQQVGGE